MFAKLTTRFLRTLSIVLVLLHCARSVDVKEPSILGIDLGPEVQHPPEWNG